MPRLKFSPLENSILMLLDDGDRHKRSEVLACLYPESSNTNNLAKILFGLRKKLKTIGEYVTCELYCGSIYYRRVKLFARNRE